MPNTAFSLKKYLPVLVAISIAAFMVQLDTSIVNIALPTIAEEMSSDTGSVSRIILFYMLAIVSTLLLFGRIGDRIGKKSVFIFGYVVFSVSSVLCGISGSLPVLEMMRVLQGIGGAMLYATLSALIIQNFGEEFRGRAFSAISVFSGLGFAAGAPLGGLIVNNIGWRWIFFINVVPGILGIIMSKKMLRPDRKIRNPKESYNIPGVLLSSAFIFTLIIALNTGTEAGWLSPKIIGLLASSAVLLGLFIRRLKRAQDPLIRPALLRNPKLTSGLISRLAVVGILNGSMLLFPFFLGKVLEIPIGSIGLLIGIFPVIVLFVSPVSGWLTDRFGSGKVSVCATILFVVATVMFLAFRFSESMTLLVAAFSIFGLATGLFFPASMKLVMGQAIEGQEGVLTAICSLSSFLGGALGIGLMETIFSFGFPGVTSFSDLTAAAVSTGFGRAMAFAVILSVFALIVILRSIRVARRESAAQAG